MSAAILVQNWWQAGLAVAGIVALNGVRYAVRAKRSERSRDRQLMAEWDAYQREHGRGGNQP